MEFTSIGELSPNQRPCKLKCRVSRLWVATNINTDIVCHLDMILLDSQGNDIWVQIPPLLMKIFQPLLKDQEVYTFSNFKVQSAPQEYRPIANDNIIICSGKTSVQQIPDVPRSIPTFKFTFMNAAQIKRNLNKIDILSDVVGQVQHVSERKTSCKGGRKTTRRHISLKLIEGDVVSVVVFGRLLPLLESFVNASGTASFVIVITSIRVTPFQGDCSLSSTSSTCLFSNIDIPEVNAFLNGNNENVAPVLLEEPSTPEVPIVTLAELQNLSLDMQNEDNVYSVEGKVVDLHPLWCYLSCPTCVYKAPEDQDTYHCTKCNKTTTIKAAKYRLRLEVVSDDTSPSFVMFENVGENFFGLPANQLFLENGGLKDSPPEIILKILGMTLKFHVKIKISMYTRSKPDFTVVKIDPDSIDDLPATLQKVASTQSIHSDIENSRSSSQISDPLCTAVKDTDGEKTPCTSLKRKQPIE
ncbi:unnamed protein product [Linum trigynum]|uniref:Replication factor A C-terminal domain-containing protein n=1 Tax=Linum trigynum TaxID=586398 RepID=A0AAV2GBM7_9ROSI